MILGSTIRTLSRQCPGYRLVSPVIARNSVSVCTCGKCAWSCAYKKVHLACKRVLGKLEDDGHAIVAVNGSCDRAEFRKCGDINIQLSNDKEIV